jgi:nucleoside-diphosphate-sugar epimerase
VYHSAGKISFHADDIPLLNRVNVDGTANMVNMALEKNIKRFCHVSSVAAIGRSAGNTVVTEKSSWKTSKENSNYAISKYAGEREVWRAIEEGLPAFIVNPTIIIGPGDWHSGSSQMFSSVAKGLKFYATGSTGFVDVRDVSNAAIQLNAKGVVAQRYILNGENLPYRTVFNTIARELKKPEATIKVTPFIGELGWRVEGVKSFLLRKKSLITRETVRNGGMDWEYSNTKVCKEIGFSFMPIEQSISDTAKYFKV